MQHACRIVPYERMLWPANAQTTDALPITSSEETAEFESDTAYNVLDARYNLIFTACFSQSQEANFQVDILLPLR